MLRNAVIVNFTIPLSLHNCAKGKKTDYVRQPFQKKPDFGVTSVNHNLKELKERSQQPF